MKRLLPLFIVLFLLSCGGEEHTEPETTANSDSTEEQLVVVEDTLPPFESVAENFETTDLILPEGFSYRILFQEKTDKVVRADGQQFPAKGVHDLSVFIPDSEDPENKGLLYISHEDKYANANLGDGGGGTVFSIELKEDGWQVVGDFNHVDFSGIGGTNRNCGGSLTPNGTIFTCEEAWAWNTPRLWMEGKGHTDTSWYNGRPIWQNMGYVVEVDPVERKAIHKHYGMGKFVHEDAHCTADGKYVYLTDDYSPGVFFRYETEKAFDYSKGQLQAYKQSVDGESGEWLNIPSDTTSWIHCREIDTEMGASLFIRHEWLEAIDGKLYISETGEDNFSWAKAKALGGTVPNYTQEDLSKGGDDYDDCFGRVLEFDLSTNKMRSYLEGGFFSDSSGCFSNPDCNTSVTIGSKTYLVLSEDINWYDRGRAGENGEKNRQMFNEIYFLDMSIENPTVDDLLRFCVAPKGSETTGVIFLPDGSMIVNIQHPWPRNPDPFNLSTTIVIEGFNK
ncbi:MAG: PhoX family protein [Flavobacteriales bacterium]|nr:PhoX family protein [Flavobacteriales bacterium]